jgi:hypothetical protein
MKDEGCEITMRDVGIGSAEPHPSSFIPYLSSGPRLSSFGHGQVAAHVSPIERLLDGALGGALGDEPGQQPDQSRCRRTKQSGA